MIRTPVFPNVPVLVVDESAFVRRTIRGMLEQTNMRQVTEASDVNEAVKLLVRMKPGLIIVDWDQRSEALVSMLRDPSRSTQTSIPVIAISARPTKRLVDAAAGQRIQSLLRKPFAPKLLWQRIGRFFTLDLSALPQSPANLALTDAFLVGGAPAGEVEDAAGGERILL